MKKGDRKEERREGGKGGRERREGEKDLSGCLWSTHSGPGL